MRVPLSWLKEFTPLRADARDRNSIEELRATLDSLGLVVEEIEHVGAGLEDIVLAKVLEIRPIEKADKIRHIFVDAGDGAALEIVCGAWNFEVGDVVPLAPVGTVLPGGMEIAQRKMRGVTSNGMLCSGRELGLSDDSAGLLVLSSAALSNGALPKDMSIGMRLIDYLGIDFDTVFDISVEPNRPDCLSVIGIARDVAARLKLPFEAPTPKVTEAGAAIASLASLAVDAGDGCRRMVLRVIEGVSPFASDRAMAQRLVLCGMRPINVLVDVSNYVMLELGQPTHPYDLDRLGGHGLTVRYARRGEHLETLDGQDRALGESTDAFGASVEAQDLLICDGDDRPVGLAGVMGGADSEIADATTRVCLEAADFEPLTVGRLAARLNLRSEASTRFWRGIDPEGLVRAADRYCELLTAACVAAGQPVPVVAKGILDSAPEGRSRDPIRVRSERVNALLGTELDLEEIAAHLGRIGFGVNRGDDLDLVLTVPSFRPDITREVDVIEEVGRQFGFEHIARTVRRSPFVGRLSAAQAKRRTLRSLIGGLGAHEALSSSLVDRDREPSDAVTIPIAVTNPISPKEDALRRTLLVGLLGAVAHNAGHRNGSVRLFELGRVFGKGADDLPVEREHAAVVFAVDGDDATVAMAAARRVIEGLGIDPAAFRWNSAASTPASGALAVGVHPSRLAVLEAVFGTDEAIGVVGEVDPHYAASFGLGTRRIGWLVFDTEALFSLPQTSDVVRPYSSYPSSDFDLDFVLSEDVGAGELETALRDAAGELCEFVRLVDVYRGASLPEATRSLTFRLRICALDHTLTDEDVSAIRARCITAASEQIGAILRG